MVNQVCQELERQAERAKLVAAHDGVDLEYLKNIMLKLYETGDAQCHLSLHICMYVFQPDAKARYKLSTSSNA